MKREHEEKRSPSSLFSLANFRLALAPPSSMCVPYEFYGNIIGNGCFGAGTEPMTCSNGYEPVVLGYIWPNDYQNPNLIEYTCCKEEDVTAIHSTDDTTNVTLHPSAQFVGPSSSCPSFLIESGCKYLAWLFSHEHGCFSPTAANEQNFFVTSYCAGCYPQSDCGYTPPNEQLPEAADTSYKSVDEDWSCVPMTLVSPNPPFASAQPPTNSLTQPQVERRTGHRDGNLWRRGPVEVARRPTC